MGEIWIVNSKNTRDNYINYVDEMFEKYKYLTFTPPRIGADRSIDQNALFHVFCTEWIAYKLDKDPRDVQKNELAGMKRTVKKIFYSQNPSADWMVEIVTDYSTWRQKKDYTSSSSWKTGEMFAVLEFMQNAAAMDGIILESKGQFLKLQKEQKV